MRNILGMFSPASFRHVVVDNQWLMAQDSKRQHRRLAMKCKFNDCGWCYCESGKSNDESGACNNPEDCDEYKIQLEERKDD